MHPGVSSLPTASWDRASCAHYLDALEVPPGLGLGDANSRDHGGDENVWTSITHHIELVES